MSPIKTPSSKLHARFAKVLVASATALVVAAPAAAGGLDDFKAYLSEALGLADTGDRIVDEAKSLSQAHRAKLQAKLDRAKLAAKGVRMFASDVKDGMPAPFVLAKSSGTTIACGDKIWMANTVNDEVLQSAFGQENKALDYIRVNLDWKPRGATSGPNVTVECKSKSSGQPLMLGDEVVLRVDPASSKLDDGKPYLLACTECGYEPLVRLDSKSEITRYKSYWKLEIPGASGAVPLGIPVRLVATNRQSHGNIGGFCGNGPGGALPVIRVNFHNHCDRARLAVAAAVEGIGRPPEWMKSLAKEAKDVLAEVEAATKSGASSTGSTPKTGGASGMPRSFSGFSG